MSPMKSAIAAFLLTSGYAFAAAPVCHFSDLISGPKTGNGDTSFGQIANANGVIVTVWCNNIGDSQGLSSVIVDGVPATIYAWERATGQGFAGGASDLYTFHKMQMVSFSIPGTIPTVTGAITFHVLVDGVFSSNLMPFTIRSGVIYFISNSGSNSNAGTYASPWLTIPRGTQGLAGFSAVIAAGDTCYVMDGVVQDTLTTPLGFETTVLFSSVSGTAASPRALVAYPGATVHIGNDAIFSGVRFNTGIEYIHISKIFTRGHHGAIYGGDGSRIIGNFVTAPLADEATGGAVIRGSDIYFYGNELTDIGLTPGATKLQHPLYVQGVGGSSPPRQPTQSNKHVAWNYFHDNNSYRAINVFNDGAYASYLKDTYIHHNAIVTQTGSGVLLGQYMAGEVQFYNNLVVRAGRVDTPPEGTQYFDLEIRAGVNESLSGEPMPWPLNVRVVNNTFCCNLFSGSTGEYGILGLERFPLYSAFEFTNNIVVTSGSIPFIPGGAWETPSTAAYKSLWSGATAPAWDSAAISGDPLFVNSAMLDFQLQALSPARGVGADTTALVTHDMVGGALVNPPDMGAFQFVNSGIPSSTIGGRVTIGGAVTVK